MNRTTSPLRNHKENILSLSSFSKPDLTLQRKRPRCLFTAKISCPGATPAEAAGELPPQQLPESSGICCQSEFLTNFWSNVSLTDSHLLATLKRHPLLGLCNRHRYLACFPFTTIFKITRVPGIIREMALRNALKDSTSFSIVSHNDIFFQPRFFCWRTFNNIRHQTFRTLFQFVTSSQFRIYRLQGNSQKASCYLPITNQLINDSFSHQARNSKPYSNISPATTDNGSINPDNLTIDCLTMDRPEFPGLMAASVVTNLRNLQYVDDFFLSALTTPIVTVACNPKGFPIAIAQSPICSRSEFPKVKNGNFSAVILITARSVFGSNPTILGCVFLSIVESNMNFSCILDYMMVSNNITIRIQKHRTQFLLQHHAAAADAAALYRRQPKKSIKKFVIKIIKNKRVLLKPLLFPGEAIAWFPVLGKFSYISTPGRCLRRATRVKPRDTSLGDLLVKPLDLREDTARQISAIKNLSLTHYSLALAKRKRDVDSNTHNNNLFNHLFLDKRSASSPVFHLCTITSRYAAYKI
nr:59-kDa immunogenic protein [Chlamydia trachomatis]